MLHRDLKPENVLVAHDGRVVIADFGIARGVGDQRTLGLVGTPAYMAPEQVRGEGVDARTDIYALGAILFELLTGRRAWPGEDPIPVAVARLNAPAPDPRAVASVPSELAEIVMRCMAREPGGRFTSAREVEAALAAFTSASAVTPEPPHAPRGPAPSSISVAVLPFRNGGPAGDAYIAAGVSEEIVDALSMTRGLRVRPYDPRLTDEDPCARGAKLGVTAVVDGSVRRQGARLRIQARVIATTDCFQIWAQRFECDEVDTFVTTDAIARAVADALAAALSSHERKPITNPEVIDIYLRAREAIRARWYTNTGDEDLALLERGMSLAPDDPGLLAQYALTLARRSFFRQSVGDAFFERARAAAERAVEVAPNLGDSWYALGTVRWNTGAFADAMLAMKRAVAHSPNLAKAHEQIASALLEVDRVEEAIARYRTVLAIDPALSLVHAELSRAYALLGDWESCDAAMRAAGDRIPPLRRNWLPIRMRLWRGMRDPVEVRDLERLEPGGRSFVEVGARAQPNEPLSGGPRAGDPSARGPSPALPRGALAVRRGNLRLHRRSRR